MISEERKEFNKQRIIDVSTRLFIEQGIASTTLAQIAKEANVVCRTVSNIFGSKSNLVLEDLRYILNKIMEPVYCVTASTEYLALTGLEQVLCVLEKRGEVLMSRPEILLLVSEIKVWAARSYHDDRVVRVYMNNMESLYKIMGASLDKGKSDGSINPRVSKKQALCMLVPSFRAVLQQLAQVKMNPPFSKLVDVEEQLHMQMAVIHAGLAHHKEHKSGEEAQAEQKGV